VECSEARSDACRTVARTLGDLGVVAGQAGLGVSTGDEVLRVLVGAWPDLRRDAAAAQIERGPKASGVYARMSADGGTLTALDGRGVVAQRLGPGTGLIAATQAPEQQPTWIVTGTDAAGLAAAVRAFQAGESALSDKFALAVSDDRPIALPVVP